MSLDIALSPDTSGTRVTFAGNLRVHGDQLAVIGPRDEWLTYYQLADRVDEVRAELGPARKLVLLAASNDLDPLVTYLAALAGGHPVLLAAGDGFDSLAQAYRPDVLAAPSSDGWTMDVRRDESAHDLHPDLAVLLSTSGSTGSPKLVRLSARNVQANADAIADYLQIRPTDRAAASLPMQYCYGLSVINSNLARGAGVLLTSDSVVDERFWSRLREHGGTSLHGVPYTFELLERAGFAARELPSLRYVTQAGGRLDPERVRAAAELGRRRGWQFYVMYGQTEATARMAYLPPELAAERPDAIGVPIPGGSFQLAGARHDQLGRTEGELVYRGPNVMLGYATGAADLTLGRTVDELATGDIARRAADGLYEVVGRTSRFVKICGLRVDLDQLERVLADDGIAAACAGDDAAVAIAVEGAARGAGAAAEAAQLLACRRLGLPADRVLAAELPELPRTARGKVDYPAVLHLVRLQVLPSTAETAVSYYQAARRALSRRRRPTSVREIYARVLPAAGGVGDTDTFVGLGGDSLHYVQASIELERLVGELPAGWPTMPVLELEARAPRRRVLAGRVTATMETAILLRAAAIVLVVATHLGLLRVLGGAHLLLVLAGWSFARFCLPAAGSTGSTSPRILRGAARVAIPSMLWIAWRATSQWDTGVASALLVSGYVGKPWTIAYWFIEVLVHILLAMSLLFAVPAARRFDQRHPFTLPLLVLVAAYGARLATLQPPGEVQWWLTHNVLWFFAIGWLAQRAATRAQKLLVLAAGALMLATYFDELLRGGLVLAGLLLVLFVPRVHVPRVLVRPIGLIAAASLSIYLTHYALIPAVPAAIGSVAGTGVGLALGIVVWLAVEHGVRAAGWLRSSRRGRSPASSRSSA